MKMLKRSFSTVSMLIILFAGCFGKDQGEWSYYKLWYRKPATQWVEALPVGNGRLGGMVFGGLKEERVQLNEETLWTGGPYEPKLLGEGAKALPEIRKLVFSRRYKEAQRLVEKAWKTDPPWHQKYQSLGDLELNLHENFDFTDHGYDVRSYRRELDLDTAIVKVSYQTGNITFIREVFVSPVDDVLVVRITSDRPGALFFSISLRGKKNLLSPGDEYFHSETIKPDTLVLRGRNASYLGVKGHLEYQARLRVNVEGGTINCENDRLVIESANAATLYLAAATSFVNFRDVSADPETRTKATLKNLEGKTFEAIKTDHVREHRRLFRRAHLALVRSEASELPTDERIQGFKKSGDADLIALFYQFGRYLLISSSRPGTQPPNLQGIWNDSMNPAWGGKYTTNINLQMNFWPVETANLSECFEPLYKMIKELAVTGQRTAKEFYGARGWVHHFNTDLWRPTAPMGWYGYFETWAAAGAWLATHLWEHYLFTCDKTFLREAYPLMKGAARFFLDTLVEHSEKGWLVTNPSNSPENWYKAEGNPRVWNRELFEKGEITTICAGPTIDMEILRFLFDACAKAAKILNIDDGFRREVLKARARLAPHQIGRYGQLQEWLEDWDDPEDVHRHLSHLWGVFPGNIITPLLTPHLADAARKSLEFRGDSGTGWSLAWKINLWARLLDGERVYKLLCNVMNLDAEHVPGTEYKGGVLPNLFSNHPPFNIDGNFGATSGIAEIFLQSHAGEIHILPALPKALAKGSFRGFCARGGFEVDLSWEGGSPVAGRIVSKCGGPCRIRATKSFKVFLDELTVPTDKKENGAIEFNTSPGKTYLLSFVDE